MTQTRPKILVVDDTEATRYAVARTLRSEGFETIEAATGTEALKLSLSEDPDLITLDIHLPDIIGFEVCRRIKSNKATEHIPILQVSASFVTSKDKIHGLEGGADSYLTHPFEPPVLVATVKALLRTKQLAVEARSANEAKSRFLSNMSHEIRTPLGVILGFAELALDKALSDDDRHEYISTIKNNATNLRKLLDQILELSKIEAGKIELETQRFNLIELVTEVVQSFAIEAAGRGLRVDCSLSSDLPVFVMSDPTRIRQVLFNIIGNAMKFTQSGSVTVTLKREGEKFAPDISCVIEDTGIGLDADQQSKLFKPFVQADSSTTRRFGGTGLGLDLSRKLANALGGDLQLLQSKPGVGSVFEFRFSAGELSDADYVRPSTPKLSGDQKLEGRLNGLRILVAEDSPDNQKLLTRFLNRAGAVVDLANDGNEAIGRVRDSQYDVILMDVQMPNLDGYGAVKSIRDDGVQTPIFALTAHAMKEDRQRALAEGFDGYLTKPIDINVLIDALASLNKI